METLHSGGRLRTTLGGYFGRLQILTGIITLGVASAILTLSRKGRYDQNRNMPAQLVPMLFAAIGLLLFVSNTKAANRSLRRKLVRTS